MKTIMTGEEAVMLMLAVLVYVAVFGCAVAVKG